MLGQKRIISGLVSFICLVGLVKAIDPIETFGFAMTKTNTICFRPTWRPIIQRVDRKSLVWFWALFGPSIGKIQVCGIFWPSCAHGSRPENAQLHLASYEPLNGHCDQSLFVWFFNTRNSPFSYSLLVCMRVFFSFSFSCALVLGWCTLGTF